MSLQLNGAPIPKAAYLHSPLDPYFDPLTQKSRLEECDLDLLGILHGHAAFHHADDLEEALDCGV